jgi:hypothetical protein
MTQTGQVSNAPDVIAGVDDAGERWLVALVRDGIVSWEIAPDAAAVLDCTRDCTAVGVDVPIGLPEFGPRACDLEARRWLGRAASSVFRAAGAGGGWHDDLHLADPAEDPAMGRGIAAAVGGGGAP